MWFPYVICLPFRYCRACRDATTGPLAVISNTIYDNLFKVFTGTQGVTQGGTHDGVGGRSGGRSGGRMSKRGGHEDAGETKQQQQQRPSTSSPSSSSSPSSGDIRDRTNGMSGTDNDAAQQRADLLTDAIVCLLTGKISWAVRLLLWQGLEEVKGVANVAGAGGGERCGEYGVSVDGTASGSSDDPASTIVRMLEGMLPTVKVVIAAVLQGGLKAREIHGLLGMLTKGIGAVVRWIRLQFGCIILGGHSLTDLLQTHLGTDSHLLPPYSSPLRFKTKVTGRS